MQTPTHVRLRATTTICGKPIPESAEGVYGYFVRSVSICHQRLVGYVLGSVEPPTSEEKAADHLRAHDAYMGRSDNAESYICRVAQRLIDERENPAHYGDNLPGLFDVNGNPITPARFSFSDLISYGPDPETGGVGGFVTLCLAKTYEDLEIAAALLSLDEAMQFASTDLAYAFLLLGEAQALADYVELAKLRRDLSADVSEESLEKAFSQLEALRDKHQRITEGARLGGQKSAQTRKQIQRTPSGEVLRNERQKLIDAGMDERAVAAHQARKYNVTSGAIRAAYKRDGIQAEGDANDPT